MSTTTKLMPYDEVIKINQILAEILKKLENDVITPNKDLQKLGLEIINFGKSIESGNYKESDLQRLTELFVATAKKVNEAPSVIENIINVMSKISLQLKNISNTKVNAELSSQIKSAENTELVIMDRIEKLAPVLKKNKETITKLTSILSGINQKIAGKKSMSTSFRK